MAARQTGHHHQLPGGDCGDFNKQCEKNSKFQFVRKFRVRVVGKLSQIYSKSHVAGPPANRQRFLLTRRFGKMGKENSWNDFGRQVSKVIFAFVEYVFQVLFGLVYGGGANQSMPPIEDLLLLESASTIALKIRTQKVSLTSIYTVLLQLIGCLIYIIFRNPADMQG